MFKLALIIPTLLKMGMMLAKHLAGGSCLGNCGELLDDVTIIIIIISSVFEALHSLIIQHLRSVF